MVIGGSSGIGLETARRARAEGAGVIITARDADRLHRAGLELGASIAAFDATDFDRLEGSSRSCLRRSTTSSLPALATTMRRWRTSTSTRPAATVDALLLLPLQVARDAAGKVRPGGTFSSPLHPWPSYGRRPFIPLRITAALPAMTKNLALELAPSA